MSITVNLFQTFWLVWLLWLGLALSQLLPQTLCYGLFGPKATGYSALPFSATEYLVAFRLSAYARIDGEVSLVHWTSINLQDVHNFHWGTLQKHWLHLLSWCFWKACALVDAMQSSTLAWFDQPRVRTSRDLVSVRSCCIEPTVLSSDEFGGFSPVQSSRVRCWANWRAKKWCFRALVFEVSRWNGLPDRFFWSASCPCFFFSSHFPNFPCLKSVMKLYKPTKKHHEKGESCSFWLSIWCILMHAHEFWEKNLNGLGAPILSNQGQYFSLCCFVFGQGKLHTESRNGLAIRKKKAATAKHHCHHVLPWAAGGWFWFWRRLAFMLRVDKGKHPKLAGMAWHFRHFRPQLSSLKHFWWDLIYE